MKRQRVNTTVTVLAMLCAAGGKGVRTHSAFVLSTSRPRVRVGKRSAALSALRRGRVGSVAARWRHSTVRPAVDSGGVRILPARDCAVPLSTFDRHSSSFSPQHPQEPDLLPVARSPGGHLRRDVKIHLTEKERSLFATLLEMVEDQEMGTTLRVAGGWVRDKLVGQQQGSHQRKLSRVNKMDIDIALDNCMGGDFAVRFSRYLNNKGRKRTSNVAFIASNPEKSKHLETATLRIDDFWVDFVNLRTESYMQDSRIPSINIGTPMEDAFRRDLTINSLFYNVNTATVEDYTGKGTSDLREGLVRTPLPPRETLMDDPLRVLRAVRFASRLDFRVHPELLEAGRHPSVHVALRTKVSRERVGCELDQMVRSASPVRAFELMDEMKLLPIVFKLPEDTATGEGGDHAFEAGMVHLKNVHHLLDGPEELEGFDAFGEPPRTSAESSTGRKQLGTRATGPLEAAAVAAARLAVKTAGARQEKAAAPAARGAASDRVKGTGKGKAGARTQAAAADGKGSLSREDIKRLALYAAFFLPLADGKCVNFKGKDAPLIHVMMAEHLKLRAKDSINVQVLISAAKEFQDLLRSTVGSPLLRSGGKVADYPRLPAGLAMKTAGPPWRVALILALTGELGTKHALAEADRERGDREQAAAIISAYAAMGHAIEGMGLEGVWDLKPMFNGGEVKNILKNIPYGPAYSAVMQEQIAWMIEKPAATRDEGEEFLRKRFEEYC